MPTFGQPTQEHKSEPIHLATVGSQVMPETTYNLEDSVPELPHKGITFGLSSNFPVSLKPKEPPYWVGEGSTKLPVIAYGPPGAKDAGPLNAWDHLSTLGGKVAGVAQGAATSPLLAVLTLTNTIQKWADNVMYADDGL